MEYRRIDVDSHVQEGNDCWTSRMSKAKWGERIPHLEESTATEAANYIVAASSKPRHRWVLDGRPGMQFPALCHEVMPDRETLPARWEDVPKSVYDARERMKAMDQDGVDAQVLYPNVSGPSGEAFQGAEPEFEAACIRAYNDMLADEFVAVNKERYVALGLLPYSDIERTVGELHYAVKRGLGLCPSRQSNGLAIDARLRKRPRQAPPGS